MILQEACHLYLPHIAAGMDKDHAIEKLGRSGITLYSATGYVSPFHSDSDEGDGHCWCEQWEGNHQTDNFAFVLGAFGIYFATESNCFWCVK
jgi:hypothetical protein